jgi:Ca-activated chloride channel family protein
MELFRNPGVLLWLASAGALCAPFLAWAHNRRRQALSAFGQPETLERLFPAEVTARRRHALSLELAALAMFFVALAGPQWGVELIATKGRARQIVVAIDTSTSMLAEDLKPNRIERAKTEMGYLIEQLAGDRVGVVAFAGNAQIQCPLTTDRAAAKLLLKSVRADMMNEPGTRLDLAVRTSLKMLSIYPGDRAIVLLTDAEDHSGPRLAEAVAEAKGEGVRIFSLIVGKPEGAPIPLRDESGNLTGYKKNSKGETVVSRPDEKSLASAAEQTNGASFLLGEGTASDLLKALENVSASDTSAASRGRYKNRFQWPLGMGLLLLLVSWLLPETSGSPAVRTAGGKAGVGSVQKTVAALLLLVFLSAPSRAASSLTKEGQKLYQAGDYQGAGAAFQEALKKDPSDEDAKLGLGASEYQLKAYSEAAPIFEEEAGKAPPSRKADALYDLGNAQFRQDKADDAAKTYTEALKLQPDAPDIRHNLAVALLRKKQQKKDDKKQKQQEQKKQDKDKDKQKNQSGGGNSPPPPAPPRPRSGMSPEDAKRLLQAVKDRENSLNRPPQMMKKEKKQGAGGEPDDW